MRDLVIYGASGHARVVIDAARRSGAFSVVALIADNAPAGSSCGGVPVVGGREALADLRERGLHHGFVAVGDCRARQKLAADMEGADFEIVTIVHPAAVVSDDTQIGEGTLIAAGAIVGPGASIGDLVIVNTKASVDHDCVVDRLVHLSPGVTLGGSAHIMEGAWVGIGATVLDRRAVGAWSIVAGGAVVTRDVAPGRKYVGVPARDIGPAE